MGKITLELTDEDAELIAAMLDLAHTDLIIGLHSDMRGEAERQHTRAQASRLEDIMQRLDEAREGEEELYG